MKDTIDISSAVQKMHDGCSIMFGGFMGVGTSERMMDEIVRQGLKNLTVIGNDTARPGVGVGKLIDAKLVQKAIVSHIGTNPETQRQMIAGEMEVELVPQGTLAEKVRSGGYGLGGFLTPTGVNTEAEENKQVLELDGQTFLVEKPLKADFAILKALHADYYGNLEYRLTAQNFNPLMAMAAEMVFVDAEEVVPVGVISPDNVRTPGILVDYILRREAA